MWFVDCSCISEKWTKVFANIVCTSTSILYGLSLSHVTDCKTIKQTHKQTNKQTDKQTNKQTNTQTNTQPEKPTTNQLKKAIALAYAHLILPFCWLEEKWFCDLQTKLWHCVVLLIQKHWKWWSIHPPCSIKSPLLYDGHLISLHYNPPLHHLETTGGKFCQTREPLRLTHHKLVWTMMKKVNACIYLDLVYTGWLLLSNQTLNLTTTQSMNGGDDEWCSGLLG